MKENAAYNEQFVGECLKKIRKAPDAEEGLNQLLRFLGERLECDRVYVFEEMDRQHIHNTYEWCRSHVSSGIQELPYVAKKDLYPWYERLADGKIHGLLGADNPPPEKMEHISILFEVLAYFVCSLVGQRDLLMLRKLRADRQKPNPELSGHNGKTILLVDDSRELLYLNERILRPQGYTILSAGTLREAGRVLEEVTPDVIVLDIDLPDGSGLAFCRERCSRADIPVVFLTAHSDAQTAKEGMEAGGFAFLTKPYDVEELQRAVTDAMDRKAGVFA